ncbi:MAG: SEC-C domain-containing protein [Fusobacteriaceae bacterium]|jgi:SEC-C motif-containing protein|nr:SEC-C domain-containing protein [Fusobacteriaceae bacterium]
MHKDILTAEQLMRARYEAYVKGDIKFIVDTHDSQTAKELDIEETKKWALESKWLGLDILKVELGKESDDTGIVEFVVKFIENGEEKIHHEKSIFLKKNGKWYYSGWLPLQETIVKGKKIKPNETCPCNSGKKYKKCCGK